MRLVWAMLIAASLGVAGCKSGDKKPAPGLPTGRDRGDTPFWADRDDPGSFGPSNKSDPLAPAARPESEGMLAGRVIDASGHGTANAFVQVTLIDQGSPAGPGKPVGVTSDAQGFFIIPGLRTGRTYELSARSEDGSRVMGGLIQTSPPNTRLVIAVREGNVSTLTPAPQPHPAEPGPSHQPAPNGTKPADPPPPDPVNDPLAPNNNDQSWRPGAAPPGAPSGSSPPPPPSRFNNNPPRSENIADDANRPRSSVPATIPGPNGPSRFTPEDRDRDRYRPAPPPPRPVTVPDPSFSTAPRSTTPRVNFTLYDPSGEAWEFRAAQGRIVLLDFWKTTCGPCLRAMPDVKELATVYGASGLEVVGVACEDSGTWEEKARAVSTTQYRQGLNYRVVLEDEQHRGRVQRLFGVRAYPTMVLVDRQGNVLWRGVGASPENFRQLEAVIKRELSRR